MPDQYLTLIEQEKAPPLPQRGRRVLYVDALGILREEDHQGRIMVIGSGLANTSGTTVKVGTTSTGAAGSQAIVTNSGTDTAVVLNFTIPQGSQGDPGVGVPSGGTTGQVATKASNTDFDVEWTTVPGVTDGDKGDITVSSSGATWTIDNDAVTYAKLQNISATQRVVGRHSGGAGDAEEVTLTQLLDWVGGAVQGDILFRSAGSWTRLGAGTAGHALFTQGPGANPAWGSVGTSGRMDVQVFNPGSGNWTKPSGANPNGWAYVILISGGGGGGSGRRGAAGTVRGGGGGGATGNVVRIEMRVSALGSTEAYTVGAGGGGGAAPVTNNTNGNTGTQGGTSTFAGFSVVGGAAGFGGSTSGGSGGSGVVGHTFIDNLVSQAQSGGAGASSTAAQAGGPSTIWLMSAGGGGGSVTAGNLNAAGAAGGALGAAAQYGGIAGGTAGAAGGTNGGSVASSSIKAGYGVGGGGGGGNHTGNGGNGGNAGGYGAGGGGGGGATDGFLPGAGGNGSDGILIVITPLT